MRCFSLAVVQLFLALQLLPSPVTLVTRYFNQNRIAYFCLFFGMFCVLYIVQYKIKCFFLQVFYIQKQISFSFLTEILQGIQAHHLMEDHKMTSTEACQ